MARTPQAHRMDEVVALVAPLLKEHGFRRRARTFNRAAEEGIVHVVSFQMGTHSYTGRFTVNVGVHVREVHETFTPGYVLSTFVPEPACMIRARLGVLAAGRDRWWTLDREADELVPDVAPLLRRHAFPFLDRLARRRDIVTSWRHDPRSLGWASPRRQLEIAVIQLHAGEREDARRLYAEYVERQAAGEQRDIVLGYGELLGLD